MPELLFDMKNDEIISGQGTLYSFNYSEEIPYASVTIFLAGRLTYMVLDEQLFSAVNPTALRTELYTALGAAFSEADSRFGQPSQIPEHSDEISSAVCALLTERWTRVYGIEPDTMMVTSVTMSPEDMKRMEEWDRQVYFMKHPEEMMRQMEELNKLAQERWEQMSPEERRQGEIETQKLLEEQKAKTQEIIAFSESRRRPKFCTNCGTPVSGGKFCTNCGHPLQ